MSFPHHPNSAPNNMRQTPRGIVVVGTHPKCGKTVASAGIAGTLKQVGFKVQAIKPLCFAAKVSISHGQEALFCDKVAPPLEVADSILAESAHQVSQKDWARMLDGCQRRAYSYLLEAPGMLASPVRNLQETILDAIDLAKDLDNPILIVTPKQPDIIAAMAPALVYLWNRNTQPLGWIAVETQPTSTPHWDMDVLYLVQHYQIPYLGEIGYSPSISVEACQQGNLLRTTEMGIDLLPIQQALDLRVPVF